MASFTYDALLNDKVRFLQGTQADLNKYLPGSENAKKGKALEGAFYLTTDTHKLYVGRKVTAVPNPNPLSVAVGDIYPEEVSSGLTVVETTTDLTTAVTNNQVHDGDIYYVKSGNILCVYESGENAQTTTAGTTSAGWVQINAPGGIRGFTSSVSADGSDTIDITHTVDTEKTGADRYKSTSFALKEGNNNIQLDIDDDADIPTVTISATDTTYTAGTAASKAASASGNTPATTVNNGAYVGLKKDNGSTLDSNVIIKGANHIGATSDANGNVTITGPSFAGKGVAASAVQDGNGFYFTLDYTPGDGSIDQSIYHATKSEIDPQIRVGVGNIDLGNNVSSTASNIHFVSGVANLGIYSKDEVDAVIAQNIADRLSAANAMTYMGTVKGSTSSSSIDAVILDGNSNSILSGAVDAHIGDTYKAACDFVVGSDTIKKGDLIILRSSDNTETAGKIAVSKIKYDIIPAGDEPYIVPSLVADPNGDSVDGTEIDLMDSKTSTSSSLVAGVNIKGGTKIAVKSTKTGDKQINLIVEHTGSAVTPAEVNGLTPTTLSASAPDGIGSSPVELFVLPSNSSIATDSTGHVTGISGKSITFRHNRLINDLSTIAYSSDTSTLPTGLLSRADATFTLYDTYGYAGQSITLESSTLQVAQNKTSNADALAIDILWDSFN